MVTNGVTLDEASTSSGHPVVQEETRPPSGTNVRAPITGKFFYTKLHPGPLQGEFYIQTKFGSPSQEKKAWLSTTEDTVGVITTFCERCDVDNKFDMAASDTLYDHQDGEEDMVIFKDR